MQACPWGSSGFGLPPRLPFLGALIISLIRGVRNDVSPWQVQRRRVFIQGSGTLAEALRPEQGVCR